MSMSTRNQLAGIVVSAVLLGVAFLWWRVGESAPVSRGPMAVVGVLTDEEHRVTPEMQGASEAMADRTAPAFRAAGHDGTVIDSGRIVGDRPVLLIFIKDGCPCSTAAEPFFARLHSAYGEGATFLGVIDGGPEVAALWADDHGTPYPVLADPGLEIVRAFEARNSAYVALIGQDGRIEALWPGYSEGILREISGRLAALTGRPEAEVGAAEAPELPYSGCPYPVEEEEPEDQRAESDSPATT